MNTQNINFKRVIGICLFIMMLISIVGGVASYINLNQPDYGYITAYTVPYIISAVFFGGLLLLATHFGWLGTTPKLAKLSRISSGVVVGGAGLFILGFGVLLIVALFVIGFSGIGMMPLLRI